MDKMLMLGQRLMLGFPGTVLDEEIVRLIKTYKIGNVILFRRNVQDTAQLRRLCAQIQELILAETGYPALIGIDQEGGIVTRLADDCVNVPGNMAMAAAGGDAVYRSAAITCCQLRGVGVNCNLAPDLDVNNNPDNPVIGVRSFGDDPESVARLGEQSVRAHIENGVMCCGKHFPGHGDTAVDSHLGLPVIDRSMEQLRQLELIPFVAAIRAGIPGIMSSHILFPQLDDGIPATMSRKIMTELLRKELGFEGLIFSDCMMMDAIWKYYGTARGVVAAAKAGVDIILVSHQDPVQEESIRALLNAELDEAENEASFRRITEMKKKYAFTEADPALSGRPEDFAEAAALARKAVTLVSGTVPPVDECTLYVGCDSRAATLVENTAVGALPFPMLLQRELGGSCEVIGIDPEEEEIAQTTEKAKNASTIVLSTINAHLRPGQVRLAEALHTLGKPMTVIALRNPYDLSLMPGDCAMLAAWNGKQLESSAVADILRGAPCTGILPVRLPAAEA